MSKENMEKFMAQLKTDSALAEKMGQIQAQYVKSLAALARESGYDLTEKDFILKNKQLSDEEPAGAAGEFDRSPDLKIRVVNHLSETQKVLLYQSGLSADDEIMKRFWKK